MDPILTAIFTQYGPYAFGVAALVVVWKLVLEDVVQLFVQDIRELRASIERVNESMQQLEVTVAKLAGERSTTTTKLTIGENPNGSANAA